MGKRRKRSGPGVGSAVALATGLLLIVIPDPATTLLGLATVAAVLGVNREA